MHVALLGVVLVGFLFLRPPRRKTTTGQRRILTCLRLLVVLLVVAAMLRPTLVYTAAKELSATVVILLDRSRSMMVTDALGDRSRWEALRGTLAASSPELASLAEDVEVKLYTFDTDTQPVDVREGVLEVAEQATGQQTAIGAVLDDVVRQEAGKRLAGVFLLSDGAQRAYRPRELPPEVATRRLADLGCPLYTFAFGQARPLADSRDIALRGLLSSPAVYVKNELPVSGTAQVTGLSGEPILVQLLFEDAAGEMTPVDSSQVTAERDGEPIGINLRHVPQQAGEFKLSLKAGRAPGELVTANNELSTFVTVLPGGLKVLYLEGRYWWEPKFVRRALDGSPQIQVDFFRVDAQNAATRPPDLAKRLAGDPDRPDVIILGDLDSQAFQRDELIALAESVRSGTGLIMLGGFHSFEAGGYQETPLADLLPIEFVPKARQRFGEQIAGDLHLHGSVRMRPTSNGERHFLMLLTERESNQTLWRDLPPLEGANRFFGFKPRAQVLAEGPDAVPLLVAHELGAGRVIAFAGDSTYRWVLGGHEDAHLRFWRQIVLWLARLDESATGKIWVRLDSRRFRPGSRVEFAIGAKFATGETIGDARFEAVVVAPDGRRLPVRLWQRGDEWTGSFVETSAPGDYTIEVQAESPSEPLGETRSRFLVYDEDLELDNPSADPALLNALSELTSEVGGQSFAPEQFGSALARVRNQALRREVSVQSKQSLWDQWPFLFLLVGILSAEWILRKRWGLV